MSQKKKYTKNVKNTLKVTQTSGIILQMPEVWLTLKYPH